MTTPTRPRSLYIEAPTEWKPGLRSPYDPGWDAVFLAGGITGCPDWQQEMRALLSESSLVLLNPRRANFPIDDSNAAEAQIAWEHHHLRRADRVLFWFSAATLCPIVLYELGAWSMTDKPIAVGVEPGYAREQDVRIQTQLARPEVEVVDSLSALAMAVIAMPQGHVNR